MKQEISAETIRQADKVAKMLLLGSTELLSDAKVKALDLMLKDEESFDRLLNKYEELFHNDKLIFHNSGKDSIETAISPFKSDESLFEFREKMIRYLFDAKKEFWTDAFLEFLETPACKGIFIPTKPADFFYYGFECARAVGLLKGKVV